MFFISGVVKGTKKVDDKNRQTGEIITKHFVGFESPKANGYDGETVVTDVQVTQRQFDAGLVSYYESIRGQEVLAPIWFQVWKSGGGKTVYFEGDGRARPTKPTATAVK